MYTIIRYHSSGGGPPTDVRVYATLREARAAVRRRLGVQRLSPARRWKDPYTGREYYHDLPPSHPDSYGCGGYEIVERP